MKRAIITQIITKDENRNEIRESLDSAWYDFANRYDLRLCPISFKQNPKDLDFDMLILSGGNSLSSVEPSDANAIRDNFEKSLLDYAVENKIPVLAVCRGTQLVNEYFGGTLKKVEGHVRTTHDINIHGLEMTVNSYHGYAIDKLGNNLEIDATFNGVVEAISSKDQLIRCIMWHPERTDVLDKYVMKII
ncbi:MAG: gamma-glutamyl-gamma-aminobutyrate hydrolase family protein [Alphaproteobacteria bacterium]|nr:gamma-glutamyl-gamma-aminobutyrate hydrolase family protein [Alphaproteobacteria bacterium]